MKKITIMLLIIFYMIVLLTGCSNDKEVQIIDMGISLKIPDDIIILSNNQKTFDYNGNKVPSLSVYGISEDKKTTINIMTFPFPPKDYINHYKSAFKGSSIKDIKYDFKTLKVPKNSPLNSINESKAIISTDEGNKTSYVYTLNFKNRNGSLIIQITGDNSKKGK